MNYISAATEYIEQGFNPLPLKKTKLPNLPEGHGFLYKPIDHVSKRFNSCDYIGIVCGTISGGFYGIDFDKHQGQDIEPIYKEFYSNPLVKYLISVGQLTVMKTPSGGYHFYYKHDIVHGGNVLARWDDEKKSTMIEIRGNGQYLATFPSPGYKKIKGVELCKLDFISEYDLNTIRNMCISYSEIHIEYKNYEKSDRKWPDKWDDNKVDGFYNNNNVDDAKLLLKEHGWTHESTRRDGIEYWIRPGKDKGTSATWGQQRNMFYVFSSSALPFEASTAYTPFNVYTILKFNGDWKSAKDSLKPPVKEEPEIPDTHSFFPIDVFPTFIRNYILQLNKTLNFHVDFTSAAVMFTVATLNGNKYKLKVKNGWEASTIFWFACVGYPGTIKTHPVKTITKPLVEIDVISKKHYDALMKVYDPDTRPRQPKPKFHQILISDYTVEALHSIHEVNKRGIGLYKDELKGFLNDMNKYRKGSDEEFWLESFNNGSYIVNRVTKEPIMINHICINMIGTIQHDVLNKLIAENSGNGLLDRFLFTASEAKVYNLTSDEISHEFAKSWSQLCKEVDKNFKYLDEVSTEVLTMDDETFATYQQIDAEYVALQNSDDISQGIKNYLSKMKTYVPRFALLLAIMDAVDEGLVIEVSNKHMINAKKIADYFVETAKKVYDSNDLQKDIREMESAMKGLSRSEKIIKLLSKGVKRAQLSRYFGISKQAISKIVSNK